MTTQRSFERLVHARMEATGESDVAARANLLAREGGESADAPVLLTSDEAVRRETGRGWEEWLDLLDDWGAVEREHPEIASWLSEAHGIPGWWAQSITVSYERASGRRALGEGPDGFTISASKTVAVPVEKLYDAFLDESLRLRWLPDGELRERTASKPKNARFDWGDGSSRVVVAFTARDVARSTADLQHERLADAGEAERMRAYWRARVATLKEILER